MEHFHFIGIGGIGMSGIAAMCRHLGYQVSGSDRGANQIENQALFAKLRRENIAIYPQDGSYIEHGRPDFIVYSSAIEADNPDFVAAPDIPRLHRSEMLVKMVHCLPPSVKTIAVAGSCGKSTVTAYTAEALINAHFDAGFLNGALSKRFVTDFLAGNFHPGQQFFVFEADESDKSLLHYHPDYAILLNIGTDHYPKAELAALFAQFLSQVKQGAVVEEELFTALGDRIPKNLPIRVFSGDPQAQVPYFVSDYRKIKQVEAIYCHGQKAPLAASGDRASEDIQGSNNFLNLAGMRYEDYRIEHQGMVAEFNHQFQLALPAPGFHTALNALAIFALLEMLGVSPETSLDALSNFGGISRRNDFIGYTSSGSLIYDDYAHNPEKLHSCLEALREISSDQLLIAFQPHGFKPFGFMRDALFAMLEAELRSGDRFFLLPPFYAGGTSSFSPTSEEVIADWQSRSRHPERFILAPDRDFLKSQLLKLSTPGSIILIAGARDNSLPLFAKSLI